MNKFGTIIQTIVVPVMTLAVGISVYFLDKSVKTFEGQLRTRELGRLETSDDRELRFKIYEAVTTSLESPDSRKQQVATALVVSMLATDDSLRSGLLQVLTTEGIPAVKQQADEAIKESAQFVAQEQSVSTPQRVSTGDWRTFNLDIFYCSEVGERARLKATAVRDALTAKGSKGRLRVRDLPPSVNASPGYHISGLAVRREAGEDAVASAVKTVADEAYGEGADFVLTSSRQGTPGYLSMFVCR